MRRSVAEDATSGVDTPIPSLEDAAAWLPETLLPLHKALRAALPDEGPRSRCWTVRSLCWDNVFCYGENNRWTPAKPGVYVLVAPNLPRWRRRQLQGGYVAAPPSHWAAPRCPSPGRVVAPRSLVPTQSAA